MTLAWLLLISMCNTGGECQRYMRPTHASSQAECRTIADMIEDQPHPPWISVLVECEQDDGSDDPDKPNM